VNDPIPHQQGPYTNVPVSWAIELGSTPKGAVAEGFRAAGQKGPDLEARIEAMLERRFGMPLLVLIRSRDEIAQTIDAAPAGHASPS
jgi:hypothetical protein